MTSPEQITHDGIVAFWLLTGGAWAVERPTADPQQANCRKALKQLLNAAVSRGVPQEDCQDLLRCLKDDPRGPRAMALAVLIASEIPDSVADQVTETYLQTESSESAEGGPEEMALLEQVRTISGGFTGCKH